MSNNNVNAQTCIVSKKLEEYLECCERSYNTGVYITISDQAVIAFVMAMIMSVVEDLEFPSIGGQIDYSCAPDVPVVWARGWEEERLVSFPPQTTKPQLCLAPVTGK